MRTSSNCYSAEILTSFFCSAVIETTHRRSSAHGYRYCCCIGNECVLFCSADTHLWKIRSIGRSSEALARSLSRIWSSLALNLAFFVDELPGICLHPVCTADCQGETNWPMFYRSNGTGHKKPFTPSKTGGVSSSKHTLPAELNCIGQSVYPRQSVVCTTAIETSAQIPSVVEQVVQQIFFHFESARRPDGWRRRRRSKGYTYRIQQSPSWLAFIYFCLVFHNFYKKKSILQWVIRMSILYGAIHKWRRILEEGGGVWGFWRFIQKY